MQFSFLTTLFAAAALAAPIEKRSDDELVYFNLASLRSGSELQYASITFNKDHSNWLSISEENATVPTFALNTTSGLLSIPDNEKRYRYIYHNSSTGDFGTSNDGKEGFSIKALNDNVSVLEWKGDDGFTTCKVNSGEFKGVYSLEYEGISCNKTEAVGIRLLVEPKTN